jgi:hypothetical protein
LREIRRLLVDAIRDLHPTDFAMSPGSISLLVVGAGSMSLDAMLASSERPHRA